MLVTNPPYSGDHKEKIIKFCLESGKSGGGSCGLAALDLATLTASCVHSDVRSCVVAKIHPSRACLGPADAQLRGQQGLLQRPCFQDGGLIQR